MYNNITCNKIVNLYRYVVKILPHNKIRE